MSLSLCKARKGTAAEHCWHHGQKTVQPEHGTHIPQCFITTTTIQYENYQQCCWCGEKVGPTPSV